MGECWRVLDVILRLPCLGVHILSFGVHVILREDECSVCSVAETGGTYG